MTAAIEIKGLTKVYRGVVALSSASSAAAPDSPLLEQPARSQSSSCVLRLVSNPSGDFIFASVADLRRASSSPTATSEKLAVRVPIIALA